jgi:CRISPR type III-B/RAMP module RAMP protein Cmr6
MTNACRTALRDVVPADANAGLLLSVQLKDHVTGSKTPLLKSAMAACANTHALYEVAFARWEANLPPGGARTTVELEGRAVIGLGAESPLETGLTLHRTYGTPLFPGSALKGLAAHYCATVWGARDSRYAKGGEYFNTIFGTTEDSGHIIFYDALVRPESLPIRRDAPPGSTDGALALDVITVHHQDYYGGGDNSQAAPTDFDDPNPVQFLSIQGRFALVVQCDVPGPDGDAWAALALKLLVEALEQWGIGGKTSAGYGRIKGADWTAPRRETAQPPVSAARPGAPPQRPSAPMRGAGGPNLGRPDLTKYQGQLVDCTILPEKTKNGGWRVSCCLEGVQLSGHIKNSERVPDDCKPGQRHRLKLFSASRYNSAFIWPERG